MDKKRAEAVKAGKFAIVGVLNTIVDMAVFALLSGFFGINIYLAQVISYSAGVANSYGLNRSWTFASKARFWSPALAKFIVCNIASLGCATLVLWLLHDVAGWAVMVAKLGSIGASLVVNFTVSRLWVFSA